jgi:hypothetical protein
MATARFTDHRAGSDPSEHAERIRVTSFRFGEKNFLQNPIDHSSFDWAVVPGQSCGP